MCSEVSQTAVSVLILRLRSGQAKQKLHTEAIRSDEVSHAAEVQNLERGLYRNSRCSRDRHKDFHLTKGGLELYEMQIEQSADVVVLSGKNEPSPQGDKDGDLAKLRKD